MDAIRVAINGKDGPFPNSKFRSDYYHLVLQKWMTGKAAFKISEVSDKLCSVLEGWIKSWFNYCVTEAEFRHSITKFKSTLISHHDILGEGMSCVSKEIVNIVEKEFETCARFKFHQHTTLGFIGSSPVESMNTGIKSGNLAAKASMGLDRSTSVQLKQVEHRTQKLGYDMAKDMNRTQLWSKSLTSKFLTRYMEGMMAFFILICFFFRLLTTTHLFMFLQMLLAGLTLKNFDLKDQYNCCYVGDRKWLLLSKIHSQDQHLDDEDSFFCHDCIPKTYPKYCRVYIVTIYSCGHMNCSCGYVQDYLGPCIHIMKVLNKIDNLVPSLFHIRWWKQYNYYFGSKFGNSQKLEKMHKCMRDLGNEIAEQSFDANGKFKGCFIGNSPFGNEIHSLEVDKTSDIYNLMMMIQKYTVETGCLEIGSNDYRNIILGKYTTTKNQSCSVDTAEPLTLYDIEDEEDNDDDCGIEITGTAAMGHGSQTFGYLSQQSECLENLVRENFRADVIGINHEQLLHKFRSLLGSLRNYDQYQRIDQLLNEEHARIISENNPNYLLTFGERGTLMLGSDESGRIETGKRKRYIYEKNK